MRREGRGAWARWARGEFEIISAVTAFGLSAMTGYAIELYLARRRGG